MREGGGYGPLQCSTLGVVFLESKKQNIELEFWARVNPSFIQWDDLASISCGWECSEGSKQEKEICGLPQRNQVVAYLLHLSGLSLQLL